MKKVFILFLSLLLLLFCVPLGHAAVVYSYLPEPVPTNSGIETTDYLVATVGGVNYIFAVSYPQLDSGVRVTLEHSSSGYEIKLTNASTVDIRFDFVSYNAITGAKAGYYTGTTRWGNASTLYRNANITAATSYGVQIVLDSSSYLPLVQIAWNDATDPSTYTNWLQSIYNRQGSIELELDIFYNAFNTFRQVNHSDLTEIYNLLSKIYSSLQSDGGETSMDQSNKDKMEEYQSIEDSLNKDYSEDLSAAFSDSGAVFTSNNAFSLISSALSEFILSNNKLNALIIFTLCLGLGVLIIGRKINA